MKKVISAIVVYSIAVFSFNAAVQPNEAKAAMENNNLRVLDYTWNCVGCGGNCLDTVIITVPIREAKFN